MYGITWVSSPRHAIATHHEHFFFLIRVSLCGYSLYGMVIRAIFLTILFFFLHLFINFFFFGWLHLHAFMCHCQSCLIFLACLCFDG